MCFWCKIDTLHSELSSDDESSEDTEEHSEAEDIDMEIGRANV